MTKTTKQSMTDTTTKKNVVIETTKMALLKRLKLIDYKFLKMGVCLDFEFIFCTSDYISMA